MGALVSPSRAGTGFAVFETMTTPITCTSARSSIAIMRTIQPVMSYHRHSLLEDSTGVQGKGLKAADNCGQLAGDPARHNKD